jgi:hypothetical protein
MLKEVHVNDFHSTEEARRTKGADVAKAVTRVSKQRPRILEDVEKLLLVWINEKQPAGDTVTELESTDSSDSVSDNESRPTQ